MDDLMYESKYYAQKHKKTHTNTYKLTTVYTRDVNQSDKNIKQDVLNILAV